MNAKTIQSYISKGNKSNVEVIRNPHFQHAYSINTEWLNEMKDMMPVDLYKKDDSSKWVLTDDASTEFECKSMGLFDEHDHLLSAWKRSLKDMRTYFMYTVIHHNKQIGNGSYYIVLNSLNDLDFALHWLLQFMMTAIGNAEMINYARDPDRK